jgi:hypothetical protein
LNLNESRKLLQAGLHSVFNAAIILLLQELISTAVSAADIADVQFAIQVFEEESKTGSDYARDCGRVLLDLRSLVQRLRAQAPLLSAPVPQLTGIPPPDGVHLKMPNTGLGIGQTLEQQLVQPQGLQFQVNEGDALYQELVTWMDNDDLQLYNSYLI